MKIVVVIDVFRCFTTACYVLDKGPSAYLLAMKTAVIARETLKASHPITIGKTEIGADFCYTIPNSPTRVLEVEIFNRMIFHRTDAGAKGILASNQADLILAASFVNAKATVERIKTFKDPTVEILAMGHRGEQASQEDDLCAGYINALLNDEKMDLTPFIPQMREGPGRYFFSDDQQQYPKDDFERCLEIDRFNFAIEAILKGDFALLNRRDLTQR